METPDIAVENDAAFVMNLPPRCEWFVNIAPGFRVSQVARPNAWWRFWQWAFFGWTWTPINGG